MLTPPSTLHAHDAAALDTVNMHVASSGSLDLNMRLAGAVVRLLVPGGATNTAMALMLAKPLIWGSSVIGFPGAWMPFAVGNTVSVTAADVPLSMSGARVAFTSTSTGGPKPVMPPPPPPPPPPPTPINVLHAACTAFPLAVQPL